MASFSPVALLVGRLPCRDVPHHHHDAQQSLRVRNAAERQRWASFLGGPTHTSTSTHHYRRRHRVDALTTDESSHDSGRTSSTVPGVSLALSLLIFSLGRSADGFLTHFSPSLTASPGAMWLTQTREQITQRQVKTSSQRLLSVLRLHQQTAALPPPLLLLFKRRLVCPQPRVSMASTQWLTLSRGLCRPLQRSPTQLRISGDLRRRRR